MQKRYVVTSSGVKAGKAYSTLCLIVEGTKANGDSYSFVNQDITEREEEALPIASVHNYEVTRAPMKKS